MVPITQFQGKYRFLSNFWPASVGLGGVLYPSVEHAYQAAKTSDQEIQRQIRTAPSPGVAKRLGATAPLRPNWESTKLYVMEGLLKQKFRQEHLRDKLLATGDAELIEGNRWRDTFWGVYKGQGRNELGNLLMKIRKEMQ